MAGPGLIDRHMHRKLGWLRDLFTPDLPKPDIGISESYASTESKFPVLYGVNKKVTGQIIFKETNDADDDDIKNDLLHIIIVWSEGECGSVDQVYIDDEPVWMGDWENGNVVPKSTGSERFKVKDHPGMYWAYAINFTHGMAGFSDEYLTAAGWRSTDIVQGKCCTYLRCEFTDEDDVWQGFPEIKADVSGRVILQPLNATLTVSQNPVDQLYDYLTNSVYGKGLSNAYIDVNSLQSQRAVCELDVEEVVGSGNYRKLFTSNVRLETEETVLDNVSKLLKSMRGWLPIVDGKLTLVIEKDDPPVDFELLEQDIIKLGAINNSSKANRFNQVIVQYTDNEADATTQEAIYPEPGSALESDLLAEDNGFVLSRTIKLETCTNYYEALHFAKTSLEISREQLRTSIACKPEASILTVGDIIPITHSYPGWNAKLFRIDRTSEDMQTGYVTLKVREHQPYIYDFENTGTKPAILDTNLTYDLPATPTNLTATALYNTFSQVLISWDGTTSDYEIVVYSGNTKVLNELIGRKNFDLRTLSIGNYDFRVRAIGGLGRRSEWAELAVAITQPPTPQENISIDNGNGVITVSPPTPSQIQAVYEGLFTTSANLDPNVDDHTLFRVAQGGRTIVVPTPDHGVTYYVWYRIVTPEGNGTWYVREVVSSGIVIEQLAPSASGPIGRAQIGGILDDLINRLDSRTSATQVDITQLAIDAITAINEQTQVNFVSAEYVAEIQGFRNEVNEALGQVLVEGGAVTAEEFSYTRILVDTHQGQISTLIQQQSTAEGERQAQATAIEQNAEAIELLTVSLGETDFNQLSLRLNAAENTIVSTSYSVTNANINIIDQVFQNALDKADLIDTAATLALAQQSITTLTDETTAQAEILTSALTIAEEAQAGYQDNITSIAQETSARVAADNLLSAQLATETANRTAAVNTVNQAITDEASARASAVQAVQSTIDDEVTNRTAQYNQVAQSVVDEASARATADSLLSSAIDDEASSRAAAVGSVSQAISDEASVRASADQTLQANIESEASTRSSQIQTVSEAIVTESENRALLAQQLTATDDEVQSQATRLTEVENQADGTQSAVDALLLTVGDVNDPTSVVRRLDQVETDSSNNSSAISAVQAEVTDLDDNVATALLQLQAVSDDVTGIKATASFGVDINGNFTGVIVNGSAVASGIKFTSQQFSLFDPTLGANALFYGDGRWKFTGSIEAGSKITSPQIEMIGTSFMKVELADGFGPDNLWYWYGPRLVDGQGNANLAALTKNNAVEWKDTTGAAYFGGSLSAGVLRNAATSTVLQSDHPFVEVGQFTTNGGPKTIVISFAYNATYTENNLCGAAPSNPSIQYTLERRIGEGSWNVLTTGTFNGTAAQIEIDEPGLNQCTKNEFISSSTTFTDTNASTQNFTYRVTTNSRVRSLLPQFAQYQLLSLISTEE